MWFETKVKSSLYLSSTTVEILMWFETVKFDKVKLISTTVEILMWFETLTLLVIIGIYNSRNFNVV